MDRYMIPDPITGKVQQGLAAIHSKERKKVVQDYVEHLIDTQASIIKSAQEYQQRYIRSRAARHNKTPPLDAYKQDDWVLATWQGLSLGRSKAEEARTVLERSIPSRFSGQHSADSHSPGSNRSTSDEARCACLAAEEVSDGAYRRHRPTRLEGNHDGHC